MLRGERRGSKRSKKNHSRSHALEFCRYRKRRPADSPSMPAEVPSGERFPRWKITALEGHLREALTVFRRRHAGMALEETTEKGHVLVAHSRANRLNR